MNLKFFLLFSAAIFIWILASKVYMLLYYWGVLLVLVSFLNSQPAFKRQPYQWINLLFFLYMLFIVWERTRHYKFAELAELLINDAEHILFANIISFLIALILVLKLPIFTSYVKRLAATVLLFNAVGFINEWFQNVLSHRPVFIFIPDSQKDLRMNVIGTGVFVFLAWLFYKQKQPEPSIKQPL